MKTLKLTRILWLVSFFFISVCAKEEEEPSPVRYDNGRLSVQFASMELGAALDGISKETGIEFSLKPDMRNSQITQNFKELPLDAGIRRLLKNFNYVMIYDEYAPGGRRVDRIILMSKIKNDDIADRLQVIEEKTASAQSDTMPSNAEIILRQDGSGHYFAPGKINEHPVEFIVDTGATLVAIPRKLAQTMRLTPGEERTVNTANGRTKGFSTMLDSIELEGLTKKQVPAIIMTNMATDQRVLLGMSFLRTFDIVTQNDKMTIKPRAGAE